MRWIVVAALVAVPVASASSTGFHKLASSAEIAPDASVSLVTLYPVLAAGQRPYRRFAVTLIAKPSQRLTVSYRVQCTNGTDDVSRQYPLQRLAASPSGKRYPLRVPMANAGYCSVILTASGKRRVKATLWGID